jgi:hypothetical protein
MKYLCLILYFAASVLSAGGISYDPFELEYLSSHRSLESRLDYKGRPVLRVAECLGEEISSLLKSARAQNKLIIISHLEDDIITSNKETLLNLIKISREKAQEIWIAIKANNIKIKKSFSGNYRIVLNLLNYKEKFALQNERLVPIFNALIAKAKKEEKLVEVNIKALSSIDRQYAMNTANFMVMKERDK